MYKGELEKQTVKAFHDKRSLVFSSCIGLLTDLEWQPSSSKHSSCYAGIPG